MYTAIKPQKYQRTEEVGTAYLESEGNGRNDGRISWKRL